MTQKKNKNQAELIKNIDRAIQELVYDKTKIIKAYNYYHGRRDPEQFRHLEENYGIGTPTSVEFVPLTRKHIDVLIGEYLSTPVLPRVSCKDKETLSHIFEARQLQINNTIAAELKTALKNTLYNSGQEQATNQELEKRLEELQDSINRNFISDYEIAGQNIVDWTMQSRAIDFANKRKLLLTDLLVSGTCYYKVSASPSKSNIELEVLNPINTFIDRNPDSPYLKDSYRSVIRRYLTKDQILHKYGSTLSKDDLERLQSLEHTSADGSSTTYMRSYQSLTAGTPTASDGILAGFEVTPLLPFERNTSSQYRLYEVFEVEWLEAEKEDDNWVINRYEGVRIGSDIYITTGKAENPVRSMDDPNKCSLSVNGIFYSDRNGDPYSLILKTANLQDKNDILYFYRDNIISESGGTGDWLDVAHLPSFLGGTVAERLLKWKAYKKSGIALFDSSQEGIPMANTTFGGYDDTIKLETIQAIDLAIQRNEETCSMITGVFREKLGGIDQKDAVTNVQVGVRQSTFITKQYYQIMDLMTREILIDTLNLAKVVYKTGISGTLILGERLNKIFTALPEYYTITDYDINISDSAEVAKEQALIQQLSADLSKNNLIDPETIIEIVTATGLTKMKEDVKSSLEKKRKEADVVNKLQQQAEELSGQLKQVTQEAQQLQQQVKALNEAKLQLEKERLAFNKELEWYKARGENSHKTSMLELEKKRIELEGLQLIDNNPNNDEIKNE